MRKKTTEINADDWRQEREEKRRGFFYRLRSLIKLLLVVAIFIYAFKHRDEIQKVCYAGFDRVMNFFTLPPPVKQKSADYQSQLDGIVTN
jgi:hypothetical protein